MKNVTIISLSLIFLVRCNLNDKENTLLIERTNIAHPSKAILFFQDGNTSYPYYNVSIVNDHYQLDNYNFSKIFSFTDLDTTSKYKDPNLVHIKWTGKNELEIRYPKTGRVWKKDSILNLEGIQYRISYRIK